VTSRRLDAGLAVAAAIVAVLTLVPDGRGWAWGAPLTELRWYASGWDSTSTMLQFTGNLALLGPLAALAVLRWPHLASPRRLLAASLTLAAGIELLQWVLPLGRVVSPVDALLNATGAIVTGLLVLGMRERAWPGPVLPSGSSPEARGPSRRLEQPDHVAVGIDH
jgi:hypothetical protein